MRREACLSAGAVCAACLLLAAGCAWLAPERPPFRYLSVELRKGARPPHYEAVGLCYRIANTAELAIASLRASFWLYGPEGAPLPGVANNHIRAEVTVAIAPGEDAEVCTSLDDVLYYVPEGELLVACFAIVSVTFGDGTAWSDPFLRYVYPERVPTVAEPDPDA